MTLQMRVDLPESFGTHDLTREGEDVMLVIQALLERYGMKNFSVVRLDRDYYL